MKHATQHDSNNGMPTIGSQQEIIDQAGMLIQAIMSASKLANTANVNPANYVVNQSLAGVGGNVSAMPSAMAALQNHLQTELVNQQMLLQQQQILAAAVVAAGPQVAAPLTLGLTASRHSDDDEITLTNTSLDSKDNPSAVSKHQKTTPKNLTPFN